MGKIIKKLSESDGMTTVEVAVIIPVLSLLITGVVFLWLFFLDMAVVRGETLRIADEAASAWKNEGKLLDGQYEKSRLLSRNPYFLWYDRRENTVKEAKDRMVGRIRERLTVAALKGESLVFRGDKVIARVDVQLFWPLAAINKIMGSPPNYTCTAVAPVDNWQERIRRKAMKSWK